MCRTSLFVPRFRVCVWVIRDTVVLGLGFPTLISDTGAGAMSVSDVKGLSSEVRSLHVSQFGLADWLST